MTKFNNSDKKKLRILSIDGGGAKAYFTAYAIKKLKEEFDIDLFDYFDLFVGNSSGSVLISMILFDIHPNTIYYQFDAEGERMFEKETFLTTINSPLFAKYSNRVLKEQLNKLFGNITLKDLYKKFNKSFLITATNFNEGKPVIFGSPNIEGLNPRYQRYLLKEAIISSAAAPFFFSPFMEELTEDWIIDGGVWSNNPSLVGLMFATSHFKKNYDEIEMLSFGQSFVEDANFKPAKRSHVLRNFQSNEFSILYSASMLSQMNFHSLFTVKTLGERYFRYSPEKEIKDVRLDEINPDFKEYAHEYYEKNKKALVAFITEGKNQKYDKNSEKRYN